jgi:hypothetical protein|tara:strand:+ start:317 stop:712 length:396 start_codon:yes stop_codon:yes gene_type:complete
MIATPDFKNISTQDLGEWLKFCSLGRVGIVFFSEGFTAVDYNLLNFFARTQGEVDSLIVVADEGTFNKEGLKLCGLLHYVTFIYQKDDPVEILKYIPPHVFYKVKGQIIPESFERALESLEECEIRQSEDA